ncbi:hypothetical protein [Hyperthermus butylicus]|uniref:Conserved archaeal protein n=1 Tax=Hyperthermus butylicus (strain DSM 5456 / JCM 9403 / PLM1-5) TaxID=415426 RepID=A2BL52_HYPBU|nr:hypothetical protein [Hyperthermus butylicus]ABM80713.1 conserved archaeal protein [Hyperthermus butylicus DSM 5456]
MTRPRRERGRETGHPGVEGTIVILDLDKFGEVVAERGWSEYEPNPATGLLTNLVERFARKWQAVVIYGLDEERGTEEAVLEIPYVEPEEVREDLEAIRREVNRLGVGVTIVAVKGIVTGQPAMDRREAYYGTPFRRYARSLLEKLKRRGGNAVFIG